MIVLARRLRRQHYDGRRMLRRPLVAVESLTTNCILVAANEALERMARQLNRKLPAELVAANQKTKAAIQELFERDQFYSRDYVTGQLIKTPSINTFFPLIAGAATPEQAAKLVELLRNEHRYWTKYPVPTVELTSPDFDQRRYWQGPTWVNTNWLIIQGLRRYEYDELAEQLRLRTLELVQKHGFSEYFSPLSGEPYGIENFSWTAALIIDLIRD
jgi:glycogen debranching enzyme